MNRDLPLVSIIIPTYNAAKTITRCLDSVKRQTYPRIEVLVVDNGSTDGTPALASPYAKVIEAGPERSAQVNAGAAQAHGDYFYRIDGDFELEETVVEACVEAMQSGGYDALVIPNRSAGDGFWARVRRLERDTYLQDNLMVAARFWKRERFFSAGGLDEQLYACEDLDFHQRLLRSGCRIGRVVPGEIHLGEARRLADYAAQSFYYGPSIFRYLVKNPGRGLRQSLPVRPSFIANARLFRRHPGLALGLVVLKAVQYGFSFLGIAAAGLGLAEGKGQLSLPVVLVGLFVLFASTGLRALSAEFFRLQSWGPGLLFALVSIGVWQGVGRIRAAQRGLPIQKALLQAAWAFSPLWAIALLAGWHDPAGRITLSMLLVAAWVACLVYASGVQPRTVKRAGPVGALICAIGLAVAALHTWRTLPALAGHLTSDLSLALFDQALWASAQQKIFSNLGSSLLFSSITGRSLLADFASPVILGLIPFYWLDFGGPALLVGLQAIALCSLAPLIYCLSARRVGTWTAVLLALGYLVYTFAQRMDRASFTPLAWAPPLILLAIETWLRGKRKLFFLLIILALLCGVEVGWLVATLGAILLLKKETRKTGWLVFFLGLGWAWLAFSALIPYYEGTAVQISSLLNALGSAASNLSRPEGWSYLFGLLAPLGFLPLIGWGSVIPWVKSKNGTDLENLPIGLLALPPLLLTIAGPRAPAGGLDAWYGVIIAPFLFLGVLDALSCLTVWSILKTEMHLAAGVFILLGSIGTALPADPTTTAGSWISSGQARQALEAQLFSVIPPAVPLAVQSPFALDFAHRQGLTVLPRVGNAEYLLFDVFQPNRLPDPDQYSQILWQAFNNPDFSLEFAQSGYLLFRRKPQSYPGQNLDTLAVVSDPVITYPRFTPLGDEAALLGLNVSQTQFDPGETVYLTYFWKCLAPPSRPYLLFTAFPGERRFEEFAFGFYPPSLWQPGQIIRHEQAIILPDLPDGNEYELAVGLWFGNGERELVSPDQLLGRDVIRVALIQVRNHRMILVPYPQAQPDEGYRP